MQPMKVINRDASNPDDTLSTNAAQKVTEGVKSNDSPKSRFAKKRNDEF